MVLSIFYLGENVMWESLLVIWNANPLAQLIGMMALLCNVLAFITTRDKLFFVMMAVSSLVWGLHFAGLELWSAMGVSFLDVGKNLLALKYPKNQKLMWVLVVLYIGIGVFSFEIENFFSLIPIINAVFSLYLVFYQEGVRLKIGFIGILLLWMSYNIAGRSIGGVISDAVLLVAGVYGAWQLWRLKAQQENT